MRGWALPGVLVVLTAGCAAPPDPQDSYIAKIGGGRGVGVKLEPDGRASGPNIEMQRYDGELRGTFRGLEVNVRLDAGHVSGLIGTRPTNLDVEEKDGKLRASGLVAGRHGDFELDARALKAILGSCGWELTRQAPEESDPSATYRGYRGCGAAHHGPADRTIVLPEGFQALSPPERATYLALLLL